MSEQTQMTSTADRGTGTCANCHVQMHRLGKLPAVRTKPAVQVFRCYGCNYIMAEPI